MVRGGMGWEEGHAEKMGVSLPAWHPGRLQGELEVVEAAAPPPVQTAGETCPGKGQGGIVCAA